MNPRHTVVPIPKSDTGCIQCDLEKHCQRGAIHLKVWNKSQFHRFQSWKSWKILCRDGGVALVGNFGFVAGAEVLHDCCCDVL